MKVLRKLKNKKIIILGIFLVGLIGVTYALFSNSVLFENKFKAASYDVILEDEFYNTWGTKNVSVKNNDTTPVVIRISYNELWSLEVGDTFLTISNKINDTDAVVKSWTEDWLNNFTDGNDGWYYYNKVLNKDETVLILTEIQKNETLIASSNDKEYYDTYNYELDFNYEAIQATKEAIKEIWNYDIEIDNDGVIEWGF